MATRDSKKISLTAAADLSSSAVTPIFIKINGDNGGDKCGAGGDAVGTSGEKPTSGTVFGVWTGPRVPITLAATLSAGAEVMSDANGKAVAWTTTNRSLGYLIEGGGSGDVVAMLFAPNGRKA